MNVMWRFLWIILFSRFRSRLTIFDEGKTTFHVLPTDVDVLFHMNNGRYFSLMDLARNDYMIRCGFFELLVKQHIYPVIASEMIRFKKSLPLWQGFIITTKLLGWDDKFFYVSQQFKVNEEVYAFGIIKARFLQRGKGPKHPNDILALIDMKVESPAMPHWVKNWQHADQAFHDETMESIPKEN